LFFNLTPLIPLSLGRRGGRDIKRGANAPLRRPISLTSFKGEGEEILERGLRPLSYLHLLPLIREGGRGMGC